MLERFQVQKLVVVGAMVVVVGALLFYVFTLPTQQRTQKEVIALSHPAPGVTFLASLITNRVPPEESQKVSVKLLRETEIVPTTIEVCADLPYTDPVCRNWPIRNGQFDPSMDLKVTAKAGALSQVITVRITASGWPREGKTSRPNSSFFQETILRLGPLHVERASANTDKFLRGLGRLRGILKDITLPILIPLVGIYFARRASQRAEEDEVRRLLLTKVQGLTKSFYTHLVYHARNSISKRGSVEGTYHKMRELRSCSISTQ